MLKTARRFALLFVLAAVVEGAHPAWARPVVSPYPVYPVYPVPAVYPAVPVPPPLYDFVPGRTCTRTERRWVPARVYYNRYGNVDRVRGRRVSVRVQVPC